VHRAVLHSGEVVVVKVQRPGLKALFDIDLNNLRLLAEQLDKQDESRDFKVGGAARRAHHSHAGRRSTHVGKAAAAPRHALTLWHTAALRPPCLTHPPVQQGIYQECASVLYDEIDYINEGRNADRCARARSALAMPAAAARRQHPCAVRGGKHVPTSNAHPVACPPKPRVAGSGATSATCRGCACPWCTGSTARRACSHSSTSQV
jgi:hypothetical protein